MREPLQPMTFIRWTSPTEPHEPVRQGSYYCFMGWAYAHPHEENWAILRNSPHGPNIVIQLQKSNFEVVRLHQPTKSKKSLCR